MDEGTTSQRPDAYRRGRSNRSIVLFRPVRDVAGSGMISDRNNRRVLLARIGAVLGALALLVSSCSEPTESTSDGSNTNWLRQCTTRAECGAEAVCTCGVCSKRCGIDTDCGSLRGARCVA